MPREFNHSDEHHRIDRRIDLLEVQLTLARWLLAILTIAAVSAAVQWAIGQ